jgi:acetyl esterase/lipase
MAGLAHLLTFLAAGISALFFFRVKSVAGLGLWMPKALVGSASAFVAAMGALGAALSLWVRAPLAIAAGVLAVLLPVRYVRRVAAPHDGFERAFGPDWQHKIAPEQWALMLKRRWVGRLPSHQGVRWERDITFWTIPGTDRELLCDIWQPPEGVSPSGLAPIYLHGGAWHWMDKDFGTRPFFRHLSAQGHVVMDVAYRLCPEVDIYGMIGNVKRAIVWMKTNPGRYDVDPARVVVGGGSTGAHLAMLAAYAPYRSELTPDDLGEADPSVRAIIAYHGAPDMRATYQRFDSVFGGLGRRAETRHDSIMARGTGAVVNRLLGGLSDQMKEQYYPFEQESGATGLFPLLMTNLLGGSPDEVPEVYELTSPITHAGPHSPPTLLLQAEHDSFLPARVSHALHFKLTEAGVPSVYVQFPQTEHGFDMALPSYAPAAQAAVFDVERFLALMV